MEDVNVMSNVIIYSKNFNRNGIGIKKIKKGVSNNLWTFWVYLDVLHGSLVSRYWIGLWTIIEWKMFLKKLLGFCIADSLHLNYIDWKEGMREMFSVSSLNIFYPFSYRSH